MLDDKQVADLKAKHGALYQLGEGEDAVVVRGPTRFEFRRWKGEVNDERKKLDAGENLLTSCIVWPEKAAFDALFDRKPGLLLVYAEHLLEVAGVSRAAEKKEL